MSLTLAWSLLGLVIAAYWLRVARMARKARRNAGASAHFIPPEKLGRRLRLVWVPVIFIWIAHPFVSAAVHHPVPLVAPLWISPACAWTGLALAAMSFIATIFCWRQMGRSWRMGIDPGERTPLITSGAFAILRHPIYALSQTMMAGTIIALPTPLLILIATLHIFLLHWEARREERHMIRLHGDVYQQYRQRVGGFIPKVRP